MPEQNYYEILNVTPQADIDTIKRAYRNLMRQYHPDNFAADIARLQKGGDKKALATLERKVQQSKIQAQRVNEAYSVLTDVTKRQAYDRRLSDDRMAAYYAEIRRERSIDPEAERRTVKSRPHRPPPQPVKIGALPWILFAGLIIVSVTVFSLLTRSISQSFTPAYSYTHVPRASTAVGLITAHELQATQDVLNATTVARTQTANDPTATPLSADQYERSADRLLAQGLYNQAITTYTRAIRYASEDGELYYKRGLAYTGLFGNGDISASNAALTDFGLALVLDTGLTATYRERGLVYFMLWQQSDEVHVRQSAIADLEQYSQYTETLEPEVLEALVMLRENIRE
jgi:tetratricopeptide (TPR) repeat protein